MRNDSILYSGSTKANRDISELKKEERKAKEIQRAKLLPVAEVILEELDKERIKTEKEILELVNVGTEKKMVKELLASLNLYEKSMKSLKTRFNIMLRDNKVTEEEEPEGFGGEE